MVTRRLPEADKHVRPPQRSNGTANPMNRYLVSMASLSAVDLVITGIFIVLSGHTEVVFEDVAANLVILGFLNTAKCVSTSHQCGVCDR
jgi:hypothetical protein